MGSNAGAPLCRLSSDLFPWGDSGKYELEELPDLPAIKEALFEVGQLARLYKQRLTSHPSEFVKMAAPRAEVLDKSILSLEVHSKVAHKLSVLMLHYDLRLCLAVFCHCQTGCEFGLPLPEQVWVKGIPSAC